MTIEAEFYSPLTKGALKFRRMHAREELGRLPETLLELLRDRDQPPVKATEVLGKNAGVRILLDDGTFRYINGVVTSFERGGVVGDFDRYRLEMRPWLWQLTLSANCRIFQDKTAVQIIDSVLAEYASAARVEKKLKGSFDTRPYTVQYRETDFDFVTRLMEEEGIYFHFSHAHDRHTLVLCNHPGSHAPMPGTTLYWGPVQKHTGLREDIITQWNLTHTLRSLKYSHSDFAADVPTTSLAKSAERTAPYAKPNDFEVYDYPGGHEDLAMAGNTGAKQQAGQRLAQLRVDAFESGHSIAAALTPERQLAVGHTFTFKDHPTDDGGYLVTSVIYNMEFAGYEANEDALSSSYECRFDAVPKSVNFQPERLHNPTSAFGPQTATVVGPAGDEIHTDKYGRVKVKFHWDRSPGKDEKSSCWLRVSQPWAGKGFGFIALPRVGDEVVVEFLEGNPDRPLITGRVYNGDNMPPYKLPDHATVSGIKTQSSKGGSLSTANELRFEDKKDSEYVWLQAEKDFHRLVKNDAFDTVKANQAVDITKNATAKIGENFSLAIGKETKLKIGADTHVDLGADLTMAVKGALGLKVTDKLSIKGEQAIALSSGMGLDVKVGQAANLTAQSSVHIKATSGVVIDGGMQITIKAGAGTITLGPAGVTIDGPMVKINCGGGGGSATAAADASPAAPKAPADQPADKDPLAS